MKEEDRALFDEPQRDLPAVSPQKLQQDAFLIDDWFAALGVRGGSIAAEDVESGRCYDPKVRSAFLLVLQLLNGGTLPGLEGALGLTREQANRDSELHATLWGGFLEAWTLRRGARHGRRAAAGAARLGRGVVRAAVIDRMKEASEKDRRLLSDDFREILTLEDREKEEALEQRDLTEKIQAAGEERLKKVKARRTLLNTMARLREEEAVPIEDLEEAATTLDELLGQGEDRRGGAR
jgi:hypothetical protein